MRHLFFLITSALLVVSCGPATEINSTYTADQLEQKNFTKIVVMTLSPRQADRSTVENALVAELGDEGIEAVPSASLFPVEFFEEEKGRTDLERQLDEAGADALLTVNLLDVDQYANLVATDPVFDPITAYPYYGYWYDYYDYWYPNVYTDAYLTATTQVVTETNLYDLSTGELIWSAQSSTVDPETIFEWANAYADEVADRIEELGLMSPMS